MVTIVSKHPALPNTLAASAVQTCLFLLDLTLYRFLFFHFLKPHLPNILSHFFINREYQKALT